MGFLKKVSAAPRWGWMQGKHAERADVILGHGSEKLITQGHPPSSQDRNRKLPARDSVQAETTSAFSAALAQVFFLTHLHAHISDLS